MLFYNGTVRGTKLQKCLCRKSIEIPRKNQTTKTKRLPWNKSEVLRAREIQTWSKGEARMNTNTFRRENIKDTLQHDGLKCYNGDLKREQKDDMEKTINHVQADELWKQNTKTTLRKSEVRRETTEENLQIGKSFVAYMLQNPVTARMIERIRAKSSEEKTELFVLPQDNPEEEDKGEIRDERAREDTPVDSARSTAVSM